MPDRKIFAAALLLLLVIAAYSFYLDSFTLAEKELDFLPGRYFVTAISGTYNSFISDIFFIRSAMFIGDTGNYFRQKRGFILKNLQVASTLDSNFMTPLFFGGVVLSQEEKDAPRCIEFLQDAFARNASAWQIPYWIGFNYHYMLGNHEEAIKYFKIAAAIPGSPKFLTSNLAMLYYKSASPAAGLDFLEGLRESMQAKGKVEEWVEKKILWLKNIILLQDKVNDFKAFFMRQPQDLGELVRNRLLERIPDDPFGEGYYLDKDSGLVKSRFGPPEGQPDYSGGCRACNESKNIHPYK